MKSLKKITIGKLNQSEKINDSYKDMYEDILNQQETENDMSEMIVEFIEQLYEVHKSFESHIQKTGWHKFSDKEPKIGDRVDTYVVCNSRYENFEYIGKGKFYNLYTNTTLEVASDIQTPYNVTHWRLIELPE